MRALILINKFRIIFLKKYKSKMKKLEQNYSGRIGIAVSGSVAIASIP
jgi:hypothetical protein